MATLTRLSDVLMPPMGEKPGAVQAQTPMFLDFLIGSSPEARKHVYSEGLDWLDAEAKKKFNIGLCKADRCADRRVAQAMVAHVDERSSARLRSMRTLSTLRTTIFARRR